MKAATVTSLSARDRQIATLLFAGDLDGEQFADIFDGRELSDKVPAAYVAAVRAWIDRLAEQIGER